jgi:molybdopterin-dependent oxidoreductase-like protein protein
VTPRGTDWGLALLVAFGLVSGLATWFAGSPGGAWVFGAHALAGFALALLLVFKLRRVLPRVGARARRDRRTLRGLLALGLVLAVLVSGVVWSTAGRVGVAGYTVLFWHGVLGAVLAVVVLAHARVRAKRPRGRDLIDRRQFVTAAVLGAGALVAWQLQLPVQRALGLPGAQRRFTGSYDAGSFTGNAFPVTSWVADRPRPLAGGYRAHGRRTRAAAARHVRVISRTGYRWSFGLRDARALLLATHVGGEPLAHGHGAPCRLVAPGRRGFQWVKWVERVEVHEDPDRALSPRQCGAASPRRGAAPPEGGERAHVRHPPSALSRAARPRTWLDPGAPRARQRSVRAMSSRCSTRFDLGGLGHVAPV